MKLKSFALFAFGYLAAEYDAAQKVLSAVPHEYHTVVYLLAFVIALAMLFHRYATPALLDGEG